MENGRLLVVDNDENLLALLREELSLEGYLVYAANNPMQAKEILNSKRIHVAIIDIKLEDHSDPWDISGIELAKGMDPLIVKIILTAYPDIDTMKKSLGPQLDGKSLAFTYVGKSKPAELLEAVKLAFEKQIKINFQIKAKLTEKLPSGTLTYLEDMKAFEYLIEEIEEEKSLNSDIKDAWEELKELFARLFYSFQEITILPISLNRGYSRTGVVFVQPFSKEQGTLAPVIVKFGMRRGILIESENYENHVKGFLRLRTTQISPPVYTKNFGGLTYTLIGASGNEICSFRDYYGREEKLVEKTLKYLFAETCKYWYHNRGNIQETNLSDLYRKQLGLYPYKKLENALKNVFPEYNKKFTIEFPGLEGSFINPIMWLKDREFPVQSYLCVTHGDLNGRNILIDENGHPWLIDFFRTGKGHLLRDFVELEADIKFNCLETSDIQALFEFESSLVIAKKCDENYEFPNRRNNEELSKAFNIIKELRSSAKIVMAHSNNMSEYYMSLIFHTINAIRYPNVRKERKRHALLSASLLSRALENWQQPR